MDATSRGEPSSPTDKNSTPYPSAHYSHPSHSLASPSHAQPSVLTRLDTHARVLKHPHPQHTASKLPRTLTPRLRNKPDDPNLSPSKATAISAEEKILAQTDPSDVPSRSSLLHEATAGLASPSATAQEGGEKPTLVSLNKRSDISDANNSKPTRHSLLSISADLVSRPLLSSPLRSRLSSDAPNSEVKVPPLPLPSTSTPNKDLPLSSPTRPPPTGLRGINASLSEHHPHLGQRSATRPSRSEYGRGTHYRPTSKVREGFRHSHYRSTKHWRTFTGDGLESTLNDDVRPHRSHDQNISQLARERGSLINETNEATSGTAKDDKYFIDAAQPSKKGSSSPDAGAQVDSVQKAEGSESGCGPMDRCREFAKLIPESKTYAIVAEPCMHGSNKSISETETKTKRPEPAMTGLRSVSVDTTTLPPLPRKSPEYRLNPVKVPSTDSPRKGSGVLNSPCEGSTSNFAESDRCTDTVAGSKSVEHGRCMESVILNKYQMKREAKADPEYDTSRTKSIGDVVSTPTARTSPSKSDGEEQSDDPKNTDKNGIATDKSNLDPLNIKHELHTVVTDSDVVCPQTLSSPAPASRVALKNKDGNKKRAFSHEYNPNEKSGEGPEMKRVKTEGEEYASTMQNSNRKRSHHNVVLNGPSISTDKSPKKRMRHMVDGNDSKKSALRTNPKSETSPTLVQSESMAQQLSEADALEVESRTEKESAIGINANEPKNEHDKERRKKSPLTKDGSDRVEIDCSAKENASSSPHLPQPFASRPLSAPVPIYVPTLSLLLASSPRGRARASGIDGSFNNLGRLSKTPPLSATLGTAPSTSIDIEEREKIFREMREIDEKAKELEQKCAFLKKKLAKRNSIVENCNALITSQINSESKESGKIDTKSEAETVKKLLSATAKSEGISETSNTRVMLPMHNNLRLIVLQNQAKAASSNAALRGLCHDEVGGLNAEPIAFKAPEPPTPEMTEKIASEITRRRKGMNEQKRRLTEEFGHLHDMWLHKLKVWKEKRSKEKKDACKERDRFLLLSTRGQSALLTSRTSSGRMSTKVVPSLSGNGFASGSTELDAMLADIEAEGGTPGSKETWSRTLATIPDRDAEMRHFDCQSVLVDDPVRSLCLSRSVNPWMLHEIVIFLEKFTTFPKNFRKIASFLGHKSTQECARFYFDNKLDLGMKQFAKEASTLKRKGLLRSHIVNIAKKRSPPDSNIVVAVKNGEVIRTSAREAVEMYVNDKEVQLVDDARGVKEVEYRKEMMEERRETVGYALKLSERVRLEWTGVDLSRIEHSNFMVAFRKCGTDWKALRTMLGAERVSSVQVREYYRLHWRRIEAEVVTKLVAARRGKSDKGIGKTTAVASPRSVSKKTLAKSVDKTPPKIGPSGPSAAGSSASALKASNSAMNSGNESPTSRRPRPGKIASTEAVTVESEKSGGNESRRNSARAGHDVRCESREDKVGVTKKPQKGSANVGDKSSGSVDDRGFRAEHSGDDNSCNNPNEKK